MTETALSNRPFKRLFDRHVLQAVAKKRTVDTEFTRPFGQNLAPALVFNQMIIAVVLRLLKVISPSAIERPVVFQALRTMAARIVAVVVNSVNAHFPRWPFTNIRKERLERVTPTLAHDNSATAVKVVVLAVFGVAASLDVFPCPVLGSSGPAVLGNTFDSILQCPASAVSGTTATKVIVDYTGNLAAIAAANPLDSLAFASLGLPNDRPHAKSLTSQVVLRGGLCRMGISHDLDLLLRFGLWLEPIRRISAVSACFVLYHGGGYVNNT